MCNLINTHAHIYLHTASHHAHNTYTCLPQYSLHIDMRKYRTIIKVIGRLPPYSTSNNMFAFFGSLLLQSLFIIIAVNNINLTTLRVTRFSILILFVSSNDVEIVGMAQSM